MMILPGDVFARICAAKPPMQARAAHRPD
jgi:hypothetical protein